ncbi:MAG: bifunctional 3-deoxy-7-phosphoheptulonate synthase/chorismate mutase [Acidimicrobiia bacterium]
MSLTSLPPTQQPDEVSVPYSDLRRHIDRVDSDILRLLAERRANSRRIAEEKQRRGLVFRDRTREEDVIADRVRMGRRHALDSSFVSRVWREIISDSVLLQQEYVQAKLNGSEDGEVVAFQGIAGSYSHLAAAQFFASKRTNVSYLHCGQFADVVAAVEQGRAGIGVLPTENTTSGGITEVYDLLLHSRLPVVGEIKLKVDHCLLGLPESTVDGLTTIYCHPQAVLQCGAFLSELKDCQVVYYGDTAASGLRIKELGDPSIGAIASEEAARTLDLRVLRSGVGNRAHNYTRFVVIGRSPISVDERVPCKTSLVMSVGNAPGALLNALAAFRDEGINLVKLESRPVPSNPFEEMFYVDLDGNSAEPRVQRALDELTRLTRFVRVLGSYPSRDLRPVTEIPEPAVDSRRPAAAPEKHQAAAPPPQASGYRLAGREHKGDDTTVRVGGVDIGGRGLVVIAGPCAVESFDQIMQCAREVSERGGHILRGGCFKPRTSPYSFQGLGLEGLDMLAEAGRAFDLPVVTEVLTPEDVSAVAAKSDILQVGARNMQNFKLLSAVGSTQRPVMLKRGMSASVVELLQAAEYILKAGNQQVFLCERGIRTFETSTRNTLDLAAVPVLRARSHLPVIVDPSHAAGDRTLVPALAMAAQAVGAHGVMVEIHPQPEEALSDGPQALPFDQFAALLGALAESGRTSQV